MTTLRAAAQQALEALENEHNSPRGYGYELSVYEARETSAAITALRAALAQQEEPCPNCASLEAQNTELDRKLSELEAAEIGRQMP